MRKLAYFAACGVRHYDLLHLTTNKEGDRMEARLIPGWGLPDTAAYFTEDQVREMVTFLVCALELNEEQIIQLFRRAMSDIFLAGGLYGTSATTIEAV